jgi:ribonuclease HII
VDEGYLAVAGVDEVGRGCLAGPVTVGVVVVDPSAGMPPRGLRDSKLLTADQRQSLVPRIQRWVLASAVASADAAEIDTYGIIAALRLAAHRALADLPDLPDCVLLDGNHDYLTPRARREPADQLVLDVDVTPRRPEPDPVLLDRHPVVRTRIKADLTCASVAAASVLAKASRDTFMVRLALEHPEYGWEVNKGYATPYHRAALRRLGPSPYHRVSWRLGLDDPDGLADPDALAELGADELAAESREALSGESLSREALPGESVSGADVDLTDGQDGSVRLGEEVRR